MKTTTLVSLAWKGGWLTVIALTAAVWILPVPFQASLLCLLGVANGWMARSQLGSLL